CFHVFPPSLVIASIPFNATRYSIGLLGFLIIKPLSDISITWSLAPIIACLLASQMLFIISLILPLFSKDKSHSHSFICTEVEVLYDLYSISKNLLLLEYKSLIFDIVISILLDSKS